MGGHRDLARLHTGMARLVFGLGACRWSVGLACAPIVLGALTAARDMIRPKRKEAPAA